MVSEIGFGAWGIGGETPGATSYGPTDDAQSRRALRRALDLGITFYDTSSVYGSGHSEELLGRELGREPRALFATKAGLHAYGEPPDFSEKALRRSLGASLLRLRRDAADVFQLHNPPLELLEKPGSLPELVETLRREGLIRAFGVSLRSPADGFAALRTLAPDAMQVNLNLLDQRAVESGLLAAAAAGGCALVARTPLAFGFLASDLSGAEFAPADHRSRWPRQQLDRWSEGARRMRACQRDPGEPPARFALRYVLSFPEVASVIPGILTPQEAAENAAAAEAGPLAAEELLAVEAAYRESGLSELDTGSARLPDPGKFAAR